MSFVKGNLVINGKVYKPKVKTPDIATVLQLPTPRLRNGAQLNVQGEQMSGKVTAFVWASLEL